MPISPRCLFNCVNACGVLSSCVVFLCCLPLLTRVRLSALWNLVGLPALFPALFPAVSVAVFEKVGEKRTEVFVDDLVCPDEDSVFGV